MSTILHRFSDDSALAVLPICNNAELNGDSRSRLREFRLEAIGMRLPFSALLFKWLEEDAASHETIPFDEMAFVVYGISKKDAVEFGRRCKLSSIWFKDGTGWYELCVSPFIDRFQTNGSRTFCLDAVYELERPPASTFSAEERYVRLFPDRTEE